MKNSSLFPCYSKPMKEYLTNKGFKYELIGLHPETKKIFWVYIKTKELQEAMSEWSKR